MLAGVGAIFTLHHVGPRRDSQFQPNRHLEVTPEFLRATLGIFAPMTWRSSAWTRCISG